MRSLDICDLPHLVDIGICRYESFGLNRCTVFYRCPGDIKANHIILHIGEHATLHWHMNQSSAAKVSVEGPLKHSSCIPGLYTIHIKHVGNLPTITVRKLYPLKREMFYTSTNEQTSDDDDVSMECIIHLHAIPSFVLSFQVERFCKLLWKVCSFTDIRCF